MYYILVDDILKAGFFIAFSKYDNVVFITNKPSCYFFLKVKTDNKVIFLSKKKGAAVSIDMNRLENTISVLNGRQSIESALNNYREVFLALNRCLQSQITSDDTIIIFNGNHASAIAAVDFFKKFNAKTLYAEISNLPGKMIFDPTGVNAQSILYQHPEILDGFPEVSNKEHDVWMDIYIQSKRKPIPQSRINVKVYCVIAIDDFLARLIPFFIREDSLPLSRKIKMFLDKYQSRKILAGSVEVKLNDSYVFYPTQVTSDTQLKINSDVDNISAINKIIELEKGKKIYVKIHPAESDISTITYFKSLSQKGDIILVSNNTVELIRNASKVYTINSTVGLETLIFEKELVVLGRAIYSKFNSSRVKQYIHNYLLDLDYFGENNLKDSHFAKMKKLTGL